MHALQTVDLLEDNVKELMKALRYLQYVVDKGVVNKAVLSQLPKSVTVIVDMVADLSRLVSSTVHHETTWVDVYDSTTTVLLRLWG